MDEKVQIKVFLLILLLACCWGPSFLFIKVAVEEIPPITIVTTRLLIGAILVYLFLRFKGLKIWPYRKQFHHCIIMAIFASALPFSLISFGELYISSSLAAILNGSTPIFTIILAHHFIPSEKMTIKKFAGILLGFSGIIFIFAPQLLDHDLSRELGAALLLASAFSYAIGMVYSRKNLQEIPPMSAACAQLIFAVILLFPLALIIDQPYLLPMPSTKAICSVVALGIIGTAIAFPVYYYIIKLAGASAVSTATLLFPIVGILLGVLVLQEKVFWNTYVGSLLIFSGLLITNNF
ncbi:MAG: EamA family transporter, partial [bacterium]|nr:EamA family transporter [bacterium]